MPKEILIQKIIELSNQGYQNHQIAIECGLKESTLQYWKRYIRKQGIRLNNVIGRPKKGTNAEVRYAGTIEDIQKQQVKDILKRIGKTA